MKRLLRPLIVAAGLLALWQALVSATGVPPFILPGPARVAAAAGTHWRQLAGHAGITLVEITAGLTIGVCFGIASALTMTAWGRIRHWLLPVLVVSQAIPVFALAPLLVLWLGYGLVSKIAMAVLIIFFPVTAACYDGLRRTDPEWLELAAVMQAPARAVLFQVRLPAALPALASGMRVAAAIAPIGAVVGEWVGSSAGLGFCMLHANARMQTDLMFAALMLLVAMALALYFGVDRLMRWVVFWR
jgi:putative hydroxymethylpyrimidine transport system permease protein